MPDHHLEDLLDSGLQESFPASDPVSVFVDVKQRPLPGERGTRGTDGVPWLTIAGAVPVLAGALWKGARWLREQRAAERRQRRRERALRALAGAGATMVGVLWVRRALRGA